ncbi:hypothetical protein HID58_070558, partial [Brassica napus]
FIELEVLARFLSETGALSIFSIFDRTLEDGTTRISFSSRLQLVVNETTQISCSSLKHLMAVTSVAMVVKKINFLSVTSVGFDMKEYQISSSTLPFKWRINFQEVD